MGLRDILRHLKPAPAPEESVVLFDRAPQGDGINWVEHRVSDPDYPVYARPQAISAKFGIEDHEAPDEREQRTAYRGLISTLARKRAHAIAEGMCLASVKRMIGPKEFEDVEDFHPWRSLLQTPSPNMGTYEFWLDASQMRDLGKGAFMQAGFDSMNVPDSLYLYYPSFGKLNAVPDRTGGIIGYVYTNNGGEVVDIPGNVMVWMRHRHPISPFEGASLLEQAAYESDVSLYQSIYARDMTAEGNVPAVYAKFKHDLSVNQSQEYGRMLTKEYRSVKNSQNKKTLVLGSDGELKTLGVSPDDLQYVASAELNDKQIMRIFGFPPAMFQESGVVANSAEVRREWMMTIQREIVEICSSLTHQFRILFGAEDSDLVVHPPDIVPMDALEKQRVREIQFRTGQRSAADFLDEDGLDTYPGSENYFMSAGLVPVAENVRPDETEERKRRIRL